MADIVSDLDSLAGDNTSPRHRAPRSNATPERLARPLSAAHLSSSHSGRGASSTGSRRHLLKGSTADRPGRFAAARYAATAALLLAAGVPHGGAAAAQLVLPQSVEPSQSTEVSYRFETPLTGHGFLDIKW